MKKVLLIHPPTSTKGFCAGQPMGIPYLGAFLKSKGHKVKLLDMGPHGVDFDMLPEKLNEASPDIVGLSFMTSQASYAKRVLEIVKRTRPETIIVAGGVHTTALPEEVLHYPEVDFIVIGEGEYVLSDLVSAIEEGGDSFRHIPGVGYKESGGIRINPRGPMIKDLNTLPFPLWEELPYDRYKFVFLGEREEKVLFPIITGRGCPYLCNFCAEEILFQRKVRFRSIDNIFAEICDVIDRFNAKYISFYDDTLTVSKDRIMDLCNRILDEKINIEWKCTATANTVDEELLRLMKEAGCRMMNFGVESGDPQVIKNIKKPVNHEQVIEAFNLTHKVGIHTTAFFMVGNLGEDWSSVQKTIDFATKLKADVLSCAIMTPYPGTPIYQLATQKGWIKERNWDLYIPSPHSMSDYRPIARNDKMTEDEILKAYYYVNTAFLGRKIVAKYGRLFFLNAYFYKRELFERIKVGGIVGPLKLISGILRSWLMSFSLRLDSLIRPLVNKKF